MVEYAQAHLRDGTPAGVFPWEPTMGDTWSMLTLAEHYRLLPTWWEVRPALSLYRHPGPAWGCMHQSRADQRDARVLTGGFVTVCGSCRTRLQRCVMNSDFEIVCAATLLTHRLAYYRVQPNLITAMHVQSAAIFTYLLGSWAHPRVRRLLDVDALLAEAERIPVDTIAEGDLSLFSSVTSRAHLTWARAATLGGTRNECDRAAVWMRSWYPADPTCGTPGTPAQDTDATVLCVVLADAADSGLHASLGQALGNRRVLALDAPTASGLCAALKYAEDGETPTWTTPVEPRTSAPAARLSEKLGRAAQVTTPLGRPSAFTAVARELLHEPHAFEVAVELAPSWKGDASSLIGVARSLTAAH